MKKIYLIKVGEDKFEIKTSFEKLTDKRIIKSWEIPESMLFESGRFPCSIRLLINTQAVAIKQGETAIRRLPLRRKILKAMEEIKKKENR